MCVQLAEDVVLCLCLHEEMLTMVPFITGKYDANFLWRD